MRNLEARVDRLEQALAMTGRVLVLFWGNEGDAYADGERIERRPGESNHDLAVRVAGGRELIAVHYEW